MISLERRDARKGLGLGLGFGGSGEMEMEVTEVEEGEACSFNNNSNNSTTDHGDYDVNMDPDAALSYIDEKLEHVLGHLQKEFDGVVSAEDLGPKFGMYGSFLPTYQRSPPWSQSRASPKNHPYSEPRSSNSLQLEGGCRSSVTSFTASQSMRPEGVSTSSTSLPVLKGLCSNIGPLKQETGMSSTDVNEDASRYESANKKSANLSENKLLKVRIKVGSDNLSTQKNAAIYSGLGLDASPSSTPTESPSGSENMPDGPVESPLELPLHMLRIMLSPPLHGSLLLSPLPDGILQLTEKGRPPEERGLLTVSGADSKSTGIVSNGLYFKGNEKEFREKKLTSLEVSDAPAELNSQKNKNHHSIADVLPKKKLVDETLDLEEVAVDTLKFPPRLNSYCKDDVTTNATGSASKEASRRVMNDKNFSDLVIEEPFHEEFLIENVSTASGKVRGGKSASGSRKDGHHKVERSHDLDNNESSTSKGRKDVRTEKTESLKQKARKNTYDELEGTNLPLGKTLSSCEGRKKSKGSHNRIAAQVSKEGSRVVSSPVAKSKESTHVENYRSKVEMDPFRSQRSFGKVSERYREFFGDMDVEQEENQEIHSEINFDIKVKDSGIVEKSKKTKKVKERSSGGQTEKLLTSKANPKASSNAGTSGNVVIPEAAPAATAVLIDDDWVCCDECQKWRLLPHGKNPKDLPDNWLCSMLDWLPGMNRCSISEEETTNAVVALFHVPPVESHGSLQNSHQNFGSVAVPPVGKRKQSSKELSNTTHAALNQSSNYLEMATKAMEVNGYMNIVNHPAISNELDLLRGAKSSDLAAEGHKLKKKEKHKSLDNFSEEGDRKRSKFIGNREPEQGCHRASKNIRTEVLADDLGSDKIGPRSSSHLDRKKLPKYEYTTSSDSKRDKKEQIDVFSGKRKDEAQCSLDNGTSDAGKHAYRDVAKKRKANRGKDTGNDLQELAENDYRTEKKARLSGCVGKEFSASGRIEKKTSQRKNQQLEQNYGLIGTGSQRSLDGGDSFKRDSGSLPSVATSSSSKVSDSHKLKANLHDMKGSPVESVSSSPMRAFGPDGFLATSGNLAKKDESTKAGTLALDGQKSCSNGGSIVGHQTGTERKGQSPGVANHGSFEASISDFQDKDRNHASAVKIRFQTEDSPDGTSHQFPDGSADVVGHNTQCLKSLMSFDWCQDDKRENNDHHHVHGYEPLKSGKCKDENGKSNVEFDSGSIKIGSINGQDPSSSVKTMDGKHRIQEKFVVKSDENVNKHVDNKDSAKLLLNETGRRESHSWGSGSPHIKQESLCNNDGASTSNKSLQLDNGTVPIGGKLASLPPSMEAQDDAHAQCPQLVAESREVKGSNSAHAYASDGDDVSKVLKETRRFDHPNGTLHNSARNSLSNGHRVEDYDAPIPVKRDSSSQAANNALKEAKNLKHMADRLKNTGLHNEGVRLYFEASLKFLHGASVLETCSSENARTGEMTQSVQIYSSTAKFCEFCAHEYEKCKEMAAAALAYKCAEVAYLRVINSSYAYANRDRYQLLALQMIPPGESPSSSASDIDNVNHPTSGDKVSLAKGISSPQVTGSHVIAAQNRPNFERVLNFVRDVNSAMEASRKSWAAFAAANGNLEEVFPKEGMASIKTALDFGFQDVEGLLRLMRVAFDAITC